VALMPYQMKPLGCDPARIKGMSERLIISHYENNYGGAVKRLNSIEDQLAGLEYASAPNFLLNGLKREQLIAMNSMILHEIFFDGLGEQSEPGPVLQSMLARDFGSYERWHSEFIAMERHSAEAPAGCCCRGLRGTASSSIVGIRSLSYARRRHAHPGARYVRTLLSHRLRCQGGELRRHLHGCHSLASGRSAL
jgi:hypothetical protein